MGGCVPGWAVTWQDLCFGCCQLTFIEASLDANNCFKYFTWIYLFNLHNNLMRQILLITPRYKGYKKDGEVESLSKDSSSVKRLCLICLAEQLLNPVSWMNETPRVRTPEAGQENCRTSAFQKFSLTVFSRKACLSQSEFKNIESFLRDLYKGL